MKKYYKGISPLLIADNQFGRNDRKEALSRMSRALDEYIIEGIKTTIPFYKKILLDPDFIKGEFYTNFLERFNNKE